MISGIDAAPSDVTMTGAIPVTRIVPARPMTNAPHQFVSLARPPPAYSSSSRDAPPAPGSSAIRLLLLLGTAIPSAEVHKARRTVKLLQGTATPVQGSVAALHTPTGENVACAPIAVRFPQRIYLPLGSPCCRVP